MDGDQGLCVATYVDVAVIDDGSVAIRGVLTVLREAWGAQFLGAFRALAEACAGRRPDRCLVVVADPFTGAVGPMELADNVRLLVMSDSDRLADVRTALRGGASGYIDKSADVPTLVAAVSAVGVGNLYFAGPVRQLFADVSDTPVRPSAGDAERTATLTPRERDVLLLIAEGYTHKQIGRRLELSKSTVDTYVHRVRTKVGCGNKADLTRVAMGMNLTRSDA